MLRTCGIRIATIDALGATGTGAIYTDKGLPTQIIRRVMVRMDAIINYLSPM